MKTITTANPCDGFQLRQALWKLGYIPRYSQGNVVAIPEVPMVELVDALSGFNLTLLWVDANSAELVQLEERRHAS